ncbi:25027_t:CDS:1, partial [Gigaspora rosea]
FTTLQIFFSTFQTFYYVPASKPGSEYLSSTIARFNIEKT